MLNQISLKFGQLFHRYSPKYENTLLIGNTRVYNNIYFFHFLKMEHLIWETNFYYPSFMQHVVYANKIFTYTTFTVKMYRNLIKHIAIFIISGYIM